MQSFIAYLLYSLILLNARLFAAPVATLVASSSCPAPIVIQNFQNSAQLHRNLLNGWSDTDGSGSLAIVNQTLKWAPNPTTDAEAGFWYTELRQGYWGKSCLNLQSFGSTVAVALKISKDKFRPAILDVGVNVGCGPTAEYRRIGSAELHAGIDRPSTFEFQLSSFLSREELGNLNAIVLTHVESTEEGTSFFVDDVEIGCDLGRGPKERL